MNGKLGLTWNPLGKGLLSKAPPPVAVNTRFVNIWSKFRWVSSNAFSTASSILVMDCPTLPATSLWVVYILVWECLSTCHDHWQRIWGCLCKVREWQNPCLILICSAVRSPIKRLCFAFHIVNDVIGKPRLPTLMDWSVTIPDSAITAILSGSSSNVNDHVTNGFFYIQAYTQCSCHGFMNQISLFESTWSAESKTVSSTSGNTWWNKITIFEG